MKHYNDISVLPELFLHESRSFFKDYKKLKSVEVEDFPDAEKARNIIQKSIYDHNLLIKPQLG